MQVLVLILEQSPETHSGPAEPRVGTSGRREVARVSMHRRHRRNPYPEIAQ